MNVLLTIPDQLASRLMAAKPDLERQALEAWMLENYRAGRLTIDELGEALGLETLNEVDGFLKAHGVWEDYSIADLRRDRRTLDELGL